MRLVDPDTIVMHTTATPANMYVDVALIRDWHVNRNQWRDIGYHWLIKRDGSPEKGRSMRICGAHVAGHNRGTVGIAMAGGVDENNDPENNYTDAQWAGVYDLVTELMDAIPSLKFLQGHRDYDGVAKACPCFDARDWWKRVSL